MQYAQGKNCLVVASAGNDSTTLLHQPAAIPGALGVAGSLADDTRLAETNHGGWVSIAALASGLVLGPSGGYLPLTGTSTAAARVAAAAALVFGHLGSTTSQSIVRGRLVGHADPVPGNWVFGRINIHDALMNQHSTMVSTDFPATFLDGKYAMGSNWTDLLQHSPDERLRVEGVVFEQLTGLFSPSACAPPRAGSCNAPNSSSKLVHPRARPWPSRSSTSRARPGVRWGRSRRVRSRTACRRPC